MGEWTKLGSVVTCQIHTDRMVHDGIYCDELITDVDALWLGPDGVVGTVGDKAILHGHHRLHPTRLTGSTQKHRDFLPHRLLSFGFTGHYDLMAEHFGAAPVGCAAEDIVVDYPSHVQLDEIAGGVQIRRGDRTIEFTDPTVANPCVPFTRYLLGDQHAAEDRVAPHRAFLGDGMRGFLVGLAAQTDAVDVAVGDEFWVRA